MALAWTPSVSFEAKTADGGTYIVEDSSKWGYGAGFGAFYRPPQGRAHYP